MVDTQAVGKSQLIKRIAVPPKPKVKIDNETWEKILQAIQENRIIEFDYNGMQNPETTHRKANPYQILLEEGHCYLFGYSIERGAERLFSLSRMKNISATKEFFTLPEDFDFTSRCGGGKFGAFISEESIDFVIYFYDDSRYMVKECIWADNQVVTDFEDRTRIEFSSPQFLKVLEWILSQGANAKPISPDWFVNDWKNQISNMAKYIGQE